MQIIQKSHRSKLIAWMVGMFLIGFAASGLFVFFKTFSFEDFAPEPTTQTRALTMFEYASTPNWRLGPRNESSTTLFSKAREDGTSACFVTVQYHKSAVLDVEASLQQHKNDLISTGAQVTQVSVTPSTFRANSGEIKYDMHRYRVTGKASEKIKGGLGLGYLELDRGYVKVEEHCDTFEELQSTAPALQSLKLLQ